MLGPRNGTARFEFTSAGACESIGRLKTSQKQAGVKYRMHPDYLVPLLYQLIHLLLSSPAGRTLNERIGVIKLSLEGRELYEWKLTEHLK
jgi:hypothetical protein